MNALVKLSAADIHLKQGNLVRLEKCVSGVLGKHPVYRRLALATEPAFAKLDSNRPLQQELHYQIRAYGEIRYQELAHSGLDYCSYNGRSFGLLDLNTAGDLEAYKAAEEAMTKLAVGEHRRIFLGTWGVTTPNEVASLPPYLYSALLTRMVKIAHDPGLSRTSAIELANAPFDRIKPNEDGSQTFVVSLSQLEKEDEMFTLGIGTITIEPGKGEKANFWDRFLAWLKRGG
jgi:hypothetical protein